MENKYQAIVIGGGMSGSWVAKELCDQGVQTLLLDRGPMVKHLADYPTASKYPWEFDHRGRISKEEKEANPIVSKCYNYYEGSKHFFVKDKEHPYAQEKPFDWIRGYQIGGKSLLWARQVQRWSQYDFDGPIMDDFAVPWPVSYEDLAPWYDKVEEFIGVSGDYDGLDTLPDGQFLKSMGLSVIDKHLQKVVKENFTDRHVIYGRCAHLSEVKEIHRKQGRGQCQNRVICERGCPFGAYFSANSSTIPWAERTGNLTIRPNSVVAELIYDKDNERAKGVKVIDKDSKEERIFHADVIFLNAGTINTNLLLLHSKSEYFEEGLGNHNGLLGTHFAFHNYRARYAAEAPGFEAYAKEGRTPTNAYIPRFQNIKKRDKPYKRGYAVAFFNNRYIQEETKDLLGVELLNEMNKPLNYGPWQVEAMMMGETIPQLKNRITLHPHLKDPWNIPQVVIDVGYDQNEEMMMEDFYKDMKEMFDLAGFTNQRKIDTGQAPGLDIHHMGGARMGKDPATSITNEHNQLHSCKNVYVTDGACMTSTATQNPSLTFMAFAARAANHAVSELNLKKK